MKNSQGYKLVARICPHCKKRFDCPRTAPEDRCCSHKCGNAMRATVKPESERITAIEEHHLRKENRRLRQQLAEAIEGGESSARFHSFVESAVSQPIGDIPSWVSKPKAGTKQAMPTAFLSDMHFDERVFPEQVEYLNGFDRGIAEKRLQNFFHNTISISKDYLRGLHYPGITLALGGDSFSGDIHEELQKTNVATIQEGVIHWIRPMVAGIKLLADEFGKVFVPSVVGNHPRGTRKPSHKMRVPNNFDWMFSQLLAMWLESDKRITFQVGKAADVDYSIYSTRYKLSHGDQFRGGSGIAGLLSPLMIGDARKRKRSQAVARDYDWLLLAHWHQRSRFKRIMVNGALKGYDEYAYHGNFDFELPIQSFWLTDPKHGVTIDAPIHVLDKSEPWLAHNEALKCAA